MNNCITLYLLFIIYELGFKNLVFNIMLVYCNYFLINQTAHYSLALNCSYILANIVRKFGKYMCSSFFFFLGRWDVLIISDLIPYNILLLCSLYRSWRFYCLCTVTRQKVPYVAPKKQTGMTWLLVCTESQ